MQAMTLPSHNIIEENTINFCYHTPPVRRHVLFSTKHFSPDGFFKFVAMHEFLNICFLKAFIYSNGTKNSKKHMHTSFERKTVIVIIIIK
jgi:hypothetical protein